VLTKHDKKVEYGNISLTVKKGKVTDISVAHHYKIDQ